MSQHRIAIIVGLAILNGMFSPALVAVFALHGLWLPFFLPPSLSLVFALSSMLLAALTLMIAGVPAALYERFAGGAATIAGHIWLGATLVLSLPAVPNVLKALGLGAP